MSKLEPKDPAAHFVCRISTAETTEHLTLRKLAAHVGQRLEENISLNKLSVSRDLSPSFVKASKDKSIAGVELEGTRF